MTFRASPSAVEDFLQCPARWGFARLPGGVREPGNEATAFGTEVHEALEHKWATGTAPDTTTRAGVVASAMAAHLPAVLPIGGFIEQDLDYEPEPGIVLHGLPDLAWPDYERNLAVTADYKTTGSFRYAKAERDALFGHAQAPLYNLMNMRRWGFTRGRALWLYALRPHPQPPFPRIEVQPSEHLITLDEATERVHLRMLPPAREMRNWIESGLTAKDAGTMPKNLRACRAYNRPCPYLFQCQPEKNQQMAEPANAFLAGLGLGDPTQPATPPAAPPATPTAPPADATAINPPEPEGERTAKGKKGAKSTAAPVLDEATIAAIADAVVDRLGLRLVRHVP